MSYQDQFTRLRRRHGAAIEPWQAAVPDLLAALSAEWRFVLGEPVGRGNTSLVIRCTRDGRDGIVKLTPDSAIADEEIRALASWAPSGRVPAVWAADASRGALLMEAIDTAGADDAAGGAARPAGDARATGDARTAGDARATGDARTTGAGSIGDVVAMIRSLHRAGDPDGFPPLRERVEFIYAHWIDRDPANAAWLRSGHAIAKELAASASAGEVVLLHGDLHAGNVLESRLKGPVAIDPRPCAGDPAFDYVDWVFMDADDPAEWSRRSREFDIPRLEPWCRALAPMLVRHASTAKAAALRAF